MHNKLSKESDERVKLIQVLLSDADKNELILEAHLYAIEEKKLHREGHNGRHISYKLKRSEDRRTNTMPSSNMQEANIS